MATPALPSLHVIYFTNQAPEVALAVTGLLKQFGQRVPLLVTTPGPAARRGEMYKQTVASLPPDQDVLVTNHVNRLPAMLAGLEPDLIVVTGFPWKLPPALLAMPKLGCINFHPALLPRYRGPNPLFWQLMNGEPETGLTVPRMEPEFDTGPILAQR
ncbi:MAG TPA: formyltransferase family protein, partial [Ktedonobacterales bacterium]